MGEIIFQRSLDDLINRFQECRNEINALNVLKNKFPLDFEKIETEIKAILTLLETSKKDLDQVKANLNQHADFYSTNNAQFKSQLLEVKKELESQAKKLEEYKFHISNNSERLGKVEDSQSNYNSKMSEAVFLGDIIKLKQEFNDEMAQAKSYSQRVLDELKLSQERSLGIVHQSRDDLFKRLADASKDYDILKRAFDDLQRKLDAQTLEFKATVSSLIDQAISGQPKPVIPSLDEAKLVMKKELESAALDAKNANMRSANNENEITILKKKLESAILMVKKIEIQDQV